MGTAVGLENIGRDQEGTSSLPQNPSIYFDSISPTLLSNNKNKKYRVETLEFVKKMANEMSKKSSSMANAGEHISWFANCFTHETQAIDSRMAVNTEMMKVLDLSMEEMTKVGKKIAFNPLETDYFFSLLEQFRNTYVFSLLLSDN